MYNPINIISMKPTTTLIGAYTRIACIVVSLWLACTATVSSQQLPASEPETPLLTLACISDIHTERSLITDINNISLRKSFTQTLNRIRAEEKIDVMVLGGDCTSDATIPIENWEKVRSLIARYSRIAFPSRDNTPVLYVTGNHDYEVANWYDLPKDYNAADYYTFPMKDDIGELTADEAFYEQAENAGKPKMTMLAAYHYVIHGFDFVILNCGKYQFANAGHYEYSVESVQWVADKLAEIYADNPDKTVFFALHIPFSDSNSIRSASKGMVSSPGEKLLKATLSKYPNLIMLYGHDHGEDKAYTRKKTSQRVTRYNSEGAVIDTYDETHVDGQLPEGYVPEDAVAEPNPALYFSSVADGKYIGYDNYNIAPIDQPKAITVTAQTDGSLYFDIEGSNPSGGSPYNYIHIGSNGYYSVGDATGLYIYEVPTHGDGLTATRADYPEVGHAYMIVGEKSGKWYALSNGLYNAGGSGQRMQRVEVTRSADGLSVSIASANTSIVWKVEKAASDPEPTPTGAWSVRNASSGKYLGFNTLNISAVDVATSVSFVPSSIIADSWSVSVSGSASEANGNFLYSGSSGRFSANVNPCPAILYHVTQMDESGISGELATEIIDGEQYIIAVRNNNDNSKFYALTDEVYNGNRLVGLLVTPDGNSVSLSASAKNAVWTISTFTSTTPVGTPSFFSAFMGSMRYYYNTIDPGDMPVECPNIVQALMVYVYKDRVELHMKNYNTYGTINGITVNHHLVPYISYRTVDVDPAALSIRPNGLQDYYTESAEVYDLTGRSLDHTPSRGLYVVGGKKVLIK